MQCATRTQQNYPQLSRRNSPYRRHRNHYSSPWDTQRARLIMHPISALVLRSVSPCHSKQARYIPLLHRTGLSEYHAPRFQCVLRTASSRLRLVKFFLCRGSSYVSRVAPRWSIFLFQKRFSSQREISFSLRLIIQNKKRFSIHKQSLQFDLDSFATNRAKYILKFSIVPDELLLTRRLISYTSANNVRDRSSALRLSGAIGRALLLGYYSGREIAGRGCTRRGDG